MPNINCTSDAECAELDNCGRYRCDTGTGDCYLPDGSDPCLPTMVRGNGGRGVKYTTSSRYSDFRGASMWFNENSGDELWFKAEGEPSEPSREIRSRDTEKSDLRKQSDDRRKVSSEKEKHLGSASPPNETMVECHRCRDGNPVSTQVPMGSTWGTNQNGCPYTINGVRGWRPMSYFGSPGNVCGRR